MADQIREAVWPLRVPRDEIWYVSWAFDASDGTALLRTDDAASGQVSLLLAESRIEEARMLLDALEAFGVPIERSEPCVDRTEDTR